MEPSESNSPLDPFKSDESTNTDATTPPSAGADADVSEPSVNSSTDEAVNSDDSDTVSTDDTPTSSDQPASTESDSAAATDESAPSSPTNAFSIPNEDTSSSSPSEPTSSDQPASTPAVDGFSSPVAPLSTPASTDDTPTQPTVIPAAGSGVLPSDAPADSAYGSQNFGAPRVSQPTPTTSSQGSSKSRASLTKLLLIVIAVIVIVGGGGAAYYFGYYMNTSVVWSQALGNTTKGYNSLVNTLSAQSNKHYTSVSEDGNFSIQSGSSHIDGTMTSQAEGENSNSSFTINLPTSKVTGQVRTVVAPNATEPDVYLQLNGITGLGDIFGSQFGNTVNSLNGKWIAINHTLLEDIDSSVPQLAKKEKAPTEADVIAAANAIGAVNAKYVFTTNKQYAVTTVVKNLGTVTVDGQKMDEYKVGFVKQNVKAYITALRNALQQSTLGSWFANETGESINQIIDYNSLESSANDINSSDTVNAWVNLKTRLLYQVKASEKSDLAENYVIFGLDYTGGNTLPFFMNISSKQDGTTEAGKVTADFNTKTDVITLGAVIASSSTSNPETFSLGLTITPSDQKVNVQAPTSSESLSTVLDKLGLGSFVSDLSTTPTTGSSTSSSDSVNLLGSTL